MKERYLKRFCFLPGFDWVKEYESSLSKPVNKTFLGELDIENIVVFKNEMNAFVIVDIKSQSDLTILKSHLKKLLYKKRQIKLIECIIESKTTQPLQRIFKMHPEEDNIIKKTEDYKRFVMTLELQNNLILREAYKEVHKADKIWPEIIQNMKIIGVKDMEIYLYGYKAFLIMDTSPSFDLERDGKTWANLPREKEWQEYVTKFQKATPKSKATEKWKLMTQIG